MSDKLTDRVKELSEKFKGLDLGSETIPTDIENLDLDPSDENQKKAGHAFKNVRDFSRTAMSVIEVQQEELQKRREGKSLSPQQPTPQTGSERESQWNALHQSLLVQAMQNTGISDPEHWAVQKEADALFMENRDMAKRMVSAESDAKTAFDTVAADFDQFAEEDLTSVQEALVGVPILDRTPDRIRKEFHAHRGANFEKFATASKPGGNGKKSSDAGAAAAAVSSVKSRGVAPGEGTPKSGDGSSVKPATEEERKEMKGLPLDSNTLHDVAIFRRAQKKKAKYEST